jgi:hypothetical protein
MVDFDCEVSTIVARGQDGVTRCFPIGINGHRDGILRTTTVPSGLKATFGTMLSLLPATLTSEPAARSSSPAMSGALSSARSSGGKSGHSLR